jgi:hypothetical protein
LVQARATDEGSHDAFLLASSLHRRRHSREHILPEVRGRVIGEEFQRLTTQARSRGQARTGRVSCRLTFELRRPARHGALAPRRTMEPATALRGARAPCRVGSPLERGVRPRPRQQRVLRSS